MSHLELQLDEFLNVSIQANSFLFIGIIVVLIIGFLVIKIIPSRNIKDWEINETELGIGNQKIRLRLNRDDVQIAYQIWVELSTRKLGIKIDPEKDVIEEVYNSWYQFFGVTRELIKNIPTSKMKRESTRKIIELSVDILNKGLRPHLTQWQAVFRKWYKQELKKERSLSPQQIQKRFPQYEKLIKNLTVTNENMIAYCQSMKEIAIGGYKNRK